MKFEMILPVVQLHQHLQNDQVLQQTLSDSLVFMQSVNSHCQIIFIFFTSTLTCWCSILGYYFLIYILFKCCVLLYALMTPVKATSWKVCWSNTEVPLYFLGILYCSIDLYLSQQLYIIVVGPVAKTALATYASSSFATFKAKATIRTPAGHRRSGLSAMIKVE